ncbi:hypothetical protein M9458_009065, partial [Cirrhinus mrigala]
GAVCGIHPEPLCPCGPPEPRPATGTGSQVEEGTPGQNSSSDPANTPIQDALVAN